MKMIYIHITILACFLTDILNWPVLCGKKYLLNSLYGKLKKSFFKTNVNRKESVSSKDKCIKVKYIAVSF